MAKIRVHELAKEVGVTSKELVDMLQSMGLGIKNHMSTVEDSQAAWIKRQIETKSGQPVAMEPPSVSEPKHDQENIKSETAAIITPKAASEKTSVIEQSKSAPSGLPAKNLPHHANNTERTQNDGRSVRMPSPTKPEEKKSFAETKPNLHSGFSEESRPRPYDSGPMAGEARPQQPAGTRPQQPAGARPQQPAGTRPQQPAGARPQQPAGTRPQQPTGTRPQQPAGTRPQQPAGTGRPYQPGGNKPQPAGTSKDRPPYRPFQPSDGKNQPSFRGGGRPAQQPSGNKQSLGNKPQPGGGVRPSAPSGPRPPRKSDTYPGARPEPADSKKSGDAGWERSRGGAANKSKPWAGQTDKDYSRPTRKGKHKKKKEEVVLQAPDMIKIEEAITVRELADKLHKNPAEIMKKLMELGTLATINQLIDFDTAEIVSSLYQVKVTKEMSAEAKILEEIVDAEDSLQLRPPVVTVMGHVDHGKTSLLDRIRQADVVSGEAGGITQHIGAYQVKVNDNRVTFIDTPGHEAFTAMRARGANLTDLVILVVAADDGVMPQTVEAINHIRAAGVPFLVAVNKVDKPGADANRVMQQLTEYSIVPEEWGGDIIFVQVSAKTGENIDTLLEMVLLLAEVNEIKANPDRLAEGVVIESKLDKGRGAVATVLVQKGTLNVGDYIISGVNWCKVRAMNDHRGRRLEKAYPSMPVEIMGWSEVPEAGERVQACEEKTAKELVNLRLGERKIEGQKQDSRISLDDLFKHIQSSDIKELNLIIKGDVQGSVEALGQSLLRLSTGEVKVNVIHSAVGGISETDVMLASASNAIIIGFNVRPDVKSRKYAEDENIDVRLYRVIYEAIEDVKKAMTGLLDPEFKEKYVGRAEVRNIFKVPNIGAVAGSYVIDGKIMRNASIRVLRDGVVVYEGKLTSLKRFKDDVKEVAENYECGMGIKDFNDIKEGDLIEAYIMEEVPREL